MIISGPGQIGSYNNPYGPLPAVRGDPDTELGQTLMQGFMVFPR